MHKIFPKDGTFEQEIRTHVIIWLTYVCALFNTFICWKPSYWRQTVNTYTTEGITRVSCSWCRGEISNNWTSLICKLFTRYFLYIPVYFPNKITCFIFRLHQHLLLRVTIRPIMIKQIADIPHVRKEIVRENFPLVPRVHCNEN